MKDIVRIYFDNGYTSTFFNQTTTYIEWKWQYIFKSEIEYIDNKPYLKGKEIYEIIE